MSAETPLLGAQRLERLAGAALETAGAGGVEVVVISSRGGLTRFANSRVHQNVWSEDVEVRVRAVTDDCRVGVVAAHTDDPDEVARVAQRALAVARVSPVDEQFAGLAPPAPVQRVPFDEATAAATPKHRGEVVCRVLSEVPRRYEAAGAYTTGATELAVFTSEGQRAYAPMSAAHLTVVVQGSTSSGYGESGGRATGDLDIESVARSAVAKTDAGADPVEVPPGTWPVVLEPAAAATLVQFLAFMTFGGRAYLEGRSFACGRMGERVLHDTVTVVDDGCAAQTTGFPVDFEGTPKQRVTLIDRGVLSGLVHDRMTARQAATESTGHALPAPNTHGPLPLNPLLQPGNGGSIGDLVAGLERGLLVTRFHYTNVVHPLETSITGMTRDGTFLVEDGQVVHGVRNLRFTQSIIGALAQVDGMSSETRFASELFFGGSRCPALRLPSFMFTSTTTF